LATIYLVETIEGIRPGLEGRLERVVEGDLITTHVGGQGTFSTPAMIGLMEITSHRSLDGLLPDGHTTVGYEVHVRHLAPAPPGSTIVVTSRLTELKGNKLYFDVECRQGDRVLGSGTHKRAIVPATF
jgi:predicted thioesterase